MKKSKDYSFEKISGLIHKGGPGFAIVFKRPITLLVWLFVRTPISANQISIINFFLPLTVAYCLSFVLVKGYYMAIISAVGMYFSECLDYSDGCTSRLKGTSSNFGIWIDSVTEDYKPVYYFAGAAWGLYRLNPSAEPWIWLAVVLVMRWFQQEWLRHLMRTMTTTNVQTKVFAIGETITSKFKISWSSLAIGNDTHTMGLIVLILFRRLDLILYLFSFYHASILCYVIFRAFKMGKEEKLKNEKIISENI